MKSRRRKRPSRRSQSSTGVRHAVGALCLVVVLYLLGQVAIDLYREGSRGSASFILGCMAALVIVTYLSVAGVTLPWWRQQGAKGSRGARRK